MKLAKSELPNVATHPHLKAVSQSWIADDTFAVLLAIIGNLRHLRIRRLDDKPVVGVDVIQELKNLLFGDNATAIMVFPARKDYVAVTNTYHIFTWDGIAVPNLVELYEYRTKP